MHPVARTALAIATVVLLASAGGGFLVVPLLTPLHVRAARNAGPVGRVGWPLAAGFGLGMAAWAGVYVAAGEAQPAIWLVPLIAAVGGAWLVHRAAV